MYGKKSLEELSHNTVKLRMNRNQIKGVGIDRVTVFLPQLRAFVENIMS